jgi:hypothetical protein
MKKFTILLFLGAIALLSACRKPFEGMTAILSNSYIDYRVSVQIVNGNPKASVYYPTNSTITLTGDAIKQGLIYTAEGAKATEEAGSVPLVNNAVILAVKPYVKISPSSPLKFTITASAPNYITNTQDVVITNADSLQYVDVKLLNLNTLPAGVSTKAETVNSVVKGEIASPFTVTVTSRNTTNTTTMLPHIDDKRQMQCATGPERAARMPMQSRRGEYNTDTTISETKSTIY